MTKAPGSNTTLRHSRPHPPAHPPSLHTMGDVEMMSVEMRVNDLDIGMSTDDIFRMSLYELVKLEPKTIEA